MKKISRDESFFWRKVDPKISFVFLGFIFLVQIGLFIVQGRTKENVYGLIIAASLITAELLYRKIFVFDIIDEVFEDGESLVFRQRGKTARVLFSEIEKIHYETLWRPQKVTVTVSRKTELGRVLRFYPPRVGWLYEYDQDVKALIDRIDEAKRR